MLSGTKHLSVHDANNRKLDRFFASLRMTKGYIFNNKASRMSGGFVIFYLVIKLYSSSSLGVSTISIRLFLAKASGVLVASIGWY
jgi:hypothetical protein